MIDLIELFYFNFNDDDYVDLNTLSSNRLIVFFV